MHSASAMVGFLLRSLHILHMGTISCNTRDGLGYMDIGGTSNAQQDDGKTFMTVSKSL